VKKAQHFWSCTSVFVAVELFVKVCGIFRGYDS
jgi:hypothetical protein